MALIYGPKGPFQTVGGQTFGPNGFSAMRQGQTTFCRDARGRQDVMTQVGNTTYSSKGMVTRTGNMWFGPKGSYSLVGSTLYGPRGKMWTGVSQSDVALLIQSDI